MTTDISIENFIATHKALGGEAGRQCLVGAQLAQGQVIQVQFLQTELELHKALNIKP